jgi:GxxExxY protein
MSERGDAESAEARRKRLNALTEAIIGAAIEVHRELGPGLLEATYQTAMAHELKLRGLPFKAQLAVPVRYKGVDLGHAFRVDLLVDRSVVVELKALDTIAPVHHAQVLSYLRMLQLPLGLLINFHVPALKAGVKRIVNDL